MFVLYLFFSLIVINHIINLQQEVDSQGHKYQSVRFCHNLELKKKKEKKSWVFLFCNKTTSFSFVFFSLEISRILRQICCKRLKKLFLFSRWFLFGLNKVLSFAFSQALHHCCPDKKYCGQKSISLLGLRQTSEHGHLIRRPDPSCRSIPLKTLSFFLIRDLLVGSPRKTPKHTRGKKKATHWRYFKKQTPNVQVLCSKNINAQKFAWNDRVSYWYSMVTVFHNGTTLLKNCKSQSFQLRKFNRFFEIKTKASVTTKDPHVLMN